MANTSPNLLSRDACYALGVVKPCYTVEAVERSNLHADLHVDLQANLQDQCATDLQSNLQGNWPQIYSIEALYRSSDEKHSQRSSRCFETIHPIQRPDTDLRQRSSSHSEAGKQLQLQTQWSVHHRLPDEKYRQRSRCSTQNTAQIYRSTGKSTGYFGSTTESTRSFRSTTWSTTRSVRKQPPVANPVANTVDPISHAHFRSNFWTPNRTEVEMKQMRQLQDRGTHGYRQQMKNSVLQLDLQSNIQADLQKDLQVNIQVKMDLQPDLQGLEGTQISSLVSFQAETSTERENLGGTCKQGPNHVSGELPQIYKDLHPTQIYNRDLHSTRICNRDLHPTWIYKTHHLTGSTPKHPAIPNGNPVTPQCNTSFSSRCSVLQ